MKTYNYQAIEVEGNIVNFDGMGKDGTLIVNKMYGDVSLFEQAIQDFAIINFYKTVIWRF